MKGIKKIIIQLGITLFAEKCFAQQAACLSCVEAERGLSSTALFRKGLRSVSTPAGSVMDAGLPGFSSSNAYPVKTEPDLRIQEYSPFLNNRRAVYSGLWAFASLNYLYADLVGIMDKNKLVQYQSGVVEGVSITPEFLTLAAGFMQIPLANVFLPHIIKNEKTLRWVQIASGAIMTVVQSGTLFVGKPTPYYVVFSGFEIAATTYITIDAIKWKHAKGRKNMPVDGE